MFVDKINLTLLSGSGGSGSISFSSKSSKTSPNGASGGNGGSIILKTRKDLFDFSHIYSKSIFKAENGGDASKNLQSGKNAGDLVIEVPLGTSIFDDEGLISVLLHENEELLLLEGGKGGAGNKDLKSKRNPNPGIAEQGQRRFKKEVRLDLSLITDIAILGLPNSGKSTLIKKITNSNAKTDSYPFTTISPNLGVLESLNSKYTICDLPGLIKGAATGVGLGKSILKHLMNTKVLIFLLDPSNTELNIDEQIKLLEDEIFTYEKKLRQLPVLKVLNKSELLTNHSKVVNVNNTEIAVFNVEGEYFAINDRCSHAEASLSEGEVYDCKVECPLHGAEFDLKTGEALTPPASKAVVCYPISTDEESIYIELDENA